MIRILILTPFRHQFRNKDTWLMSHESYYLDQVKDKDEIKYMISDLFPFREFIYVNTAELNSELLNEIKNEQGFSKFGDDTTSLVIEETAAHSFLSIEEASSLPAIEPVTNIFELQSTSYNTVEKPEEVIAPGILTSDELPVAEISDVSIIDRDSEREERQKVLDALHWRKVKDIAEQYEIDYTDKDKVIQSILKLEFE